MIYKILHRELKIEQQELGLNTFIRLYLHFKKSIFYWNRGHLIFHAPYLIARKLQPTLPGNNSNHATPTPFSHMAMQISRTIAVLFYLKPNAESSNVQFSYS